MILTVFYLLFLALGLTILFSALFKNAGPWGSFWAFMGILFLSMLAFALWVPPVGPVWYEVAWFDLLIIGMLIALLLGAAGEPTRDVIRDERGEVDLVAEEQAERGAVTLFGVFFWLFMVGVAILVMIGVARFIQMI